MSQYGDHPSLTADNYNGVKNPEELDIQP